MENSVVQETSVNRSSTSGGGGHGADCTCGPLLELPVAARKEEAGGGIDINRAQRSVVGPTPRGQSLLLSGFLNDSEWLSISSREDEKDLDASRESSHRSAVKPPASSRVLVKFRETA